MDETSLALERLVEETHQSLVREGLIQAGSGAPVYPMASVPSLEAVDQALEELQRGLDQIDNSLSRPIPAWNDDFAMMGRAPAGKWQHDHRDALLSPALRLWHERCSNALDRFTRSTDTE
jgi:hypothetical protein